MNKIAILTATRSEYGLLKNLIKELNDISYFKVDVLVTGAHLSKQYGMTYKEIENDGIEIACKVDMNIDNSTAAGISKSMGRAMIGFADYFEINKPDALIVLGDRYETLAVCCVAMNARVPIFHLHGGETTEGAIDEAVRHSISKMSYLHFTSTEEYRQRVIQLGESPDRVFNVGAVGIDNIIKEPKFTKEELAKNLDFDLSKPYAVVTFHPVTLEADVADQCNELIKAMDAFSELNFIVTGANADCGGATINDILYNYASHRKNVYFTISLGMKRYLSALKYCSFVLGNSSSGLIEAPSFKIPTVNVGNRQKGRIRGDSVIDCDTDRDDIIKGINQALDQEFRIRISKSANPYGDGKAVSRVVSIITSKLKGAGFDIKKKFYDINFSMIE